MLQFVACPGCKQKLAINEHVSDGADVVCANRNCETVLRLVGRKPLKVEIVPPEQSRNASSQPESYG